LFTNLTCLNNELFLLLRETKAQVHSSLYSHDAAIHDSITGMAGSFDCTVKGLRRLLAAEIEAYVNLVLMEKNARGRDKTVAFLGGLGIGPDHIKISCARPQGRGADLPPMTAPPFWPRKFDGWTVENGTGLAAKTCWAGRTAIASNGDVFVCVGERTPIGNVVSASFRSIVQSAAMRSLWQITLEDVPGCSRCEYRYGCFDCRADAHLLTGDLLGRDPTCPYDPETGQWRYEEIAMSDKPKRKDGFVVEEVENDLVVADFSRSQMHVLNPVAAAVWDMCDGRHTVEEMAELVAAHFPIPLADVCRDVACILGEFGAKDLVE
jgi:radical SAM protein with 4Fe4S-binding SPASM domain